MAMNRSGVLFSFFLLFLLLYPADALFGIGTKKAQPKNYSPGEVKDNTQTYLAKMKHDRSRQEEAAFYRSTTKPGENSLRDLARHAAKSVIQDTRKEMRSTTRWFKDTHEDLRRMARKSDAHEEKDLHSRVREAVSWTKKSGDPRNSYSGFNLRPFDDERRGDSALHGVPSSSQKGKESSGKADSVKLSRESSPRSGVYDVLTSPSKGKSFGKETEGSSRLTRTGSNGSNSSSSSSASPRSVRTRRANGP